MTLQRLLRHAANPAKLPALIWKNITYPFSPQAAERRYDRRLGIDTAGYLTSQQLGLGEEAGNSQPYGATPPAIAEFLIGKIAPRAKGFTFLDIGSGKGRVLLIAALFPFRKVIGVEHSAPLNETAENNVRQFAKRHPKMAPVEVVTADATKFALPDEPLVLFLFNPLTPEAIRQFGLALKDSYQRVPRKIICIYYNPAHPEIFAELGIFTACEKVDCPADPLNHFSKLRFPAMIFET